MTPGPATSVSFCDLDAAATGDETQLLCAAEAVRASRFVFDRDRRRFIRGRAFLRRTLGEALGLPPQDVPLRTGAGGKPFVPDTRLRFSLSHSGPLAALAVTEGVEVGIDVELAGPNSGLARDLDLLSGNVLTRAERRRLKDTPAPDRPVAFLALWTAKEARMKLTGEGLRLDPRRIALDLDGCRPVGYLAPDQPRAQLRHVPVPDFDAVCHLALAREEPA